MEGGGRNRAGGRRVVDVAVPESWRVIGGYEAPMYRAIARYLRGELSRVGAAGAVLPSEAEMARRYGVSRMTLRQALDELAEEGLIQRRQGRATVISERRYVREYAGLRSSSRKLLAVAEFRAREYWTSKSEHCRKLCVTWRGSESRRQLTTASANSDWLTGSPWGSIRPMSISVCVRS